MSLESAKKFLNVKGTIKKDGYLAKWEITSILSIDHEFNLGKLSFMTMNNSHHILSEVPIGSDDINESEGDGEQTEEDIRDRKVRNENISRRHHLLVICFFVIVYCYHQL